MGIRIDKGKCTGCPGRDEPPCVKYCPGNLIVIAPETKKGPHPGAEGLLGLYGLC